MSLNQVVRRLTGGWGLVSLAAGTLFCVLLFTYGVTQDVPIGQIEGTVTLAETGKPFPNAQVNLSVHDDDEARSHYVTADENGHFRFRNLRTGDYDVTVSENEHQAKSPLVTVVEGRTLHLNVKLTPNDPYLKMYASQRVWLPGDTPQVELHGFRAGESITVEVDRVDFQSLMNASNFGKAVRALRASETYSVPPVFEKYASKAVVFQLKVKNADAEGAFVDPLDIPNLPEGFYWVKCSGKSSKAATYINVSHIALVTKTARGQALAYVTDLRTGRPVAGATIWARQKPDLVSSVATDANGLAELSYFTDTSGEDSRAAIIALQGKSTAAVGVYTSEDSENSGKAKFVLYTDRPIYRPGDEVQFKGIVRQTSGLAYRQPTAGKVDIQINDTDDQPISKFRVDVSSHGAFNGHFTTSKEAGPGLYRIVAEPVLADVVRTL